MKQLAVPLGVVLFGLGFALLLFPRKALYLERRITGVTEEDLQGALIFSEATRLWVNRFTGIGLMLIGGLFASLALF